MAVQAALAIDAGLAEVVLCVRGDNTRSGISSSGMIAQAREMTQGEFEWPYGVTTIGGYGLLAQRYMHEYNVPQEALAAVVATQSEHGALKWNAMLREAVTIEDVLDSRMIATPFHVSDCSLVNDGAAAFLVTTADRAKSMKTKPVYLTGIGEGYSHQYISQAQSVDSVRDGLGRAGRRAMEVAGITPDDLDVAEIYDSFSFTPLIALEGFGICGKGEAGDWVLEGNAKLGGKLPMNTAGGLIRQAHLGAMHHIVEAALQLRGEADDTARGGGNHQVPDAKLAITERLRGNPGCRRAPSCCPANRRRPEQGERSQWLKGMKPASRGRTPRSRKVRARGPAVLGWDQGRQASASDGPDGTPFWYPRAYAKGNLGEVTWTESKGEGTVYTYSIHYIGPPGFSKRATRRTSSRWSTSTRASVS